MTDVDIALHLAYLCQQCVELCWAQGQSLQLPDTGTSVDTTLLGGHFAWGPAGTSLWISGELTVMVSVLNESESKWSNRYSFTQVLLNTAWEEIFVGGEALPLSTCRNWLKKWPHVPCAEKLYELVAFDFGIAKDCSWGGDSALMSVPFNFMLGPNLRKITTKVRLVVNYASTEAVSWQQIDRLFLQDQKKVLLVWTFHETLLPLLQLQ